MSSTIFREVIAAYKAAIGDNTVENKSVIDLTQPDEIKGVKVEDEKRNETEEEETDCAICFETINSLTCREAITRCTTCRNRLHSECLNVNQYN